MPGLLDATMSLPPIPSHKRQLELARRAHDGDRAAFDEMLLGNLRLVLHWAQRYQGHGVELEDLVQEGTFGLYRAIEKFDPDAGYHFSTYATWWVRQSLRRANATQGRTIRIPDNVLDAEVAAEQLGDEHVPTPRVTASLDASYTDAGDSPLSGAIADDAPSTDELAERLVLDEELRAAVDRLPDPLPRLVRLRFGLDGEAPMAKSAVAERLGIGQRKMIRLEDKALSLLRQDVVLALAG